MGINVEAIQYTPESSAENDIIVYKGPQEDFGACAQLNVAPSQMALFVHEGEIIPLPPGHHVLKESNNSPFDSINRLQRLFSKGKSTYPCSVYFINLVTLQDLRFGTQNPIQMEDAQNGMILHVRAAGLFGAHLNNDDHDGKDIIKFFTKVNGTRAVFTKEDLAAYLRGKIIERINDNLGKIMIDRGIGILSVASHYAELSSIMQEQLTPFFADFGIAIDNFSFVTINVPDEDLEDLKKARSIDIQSAAMARKRQREGYSYQQEKGFDVMKTAAGNEATPGQFMGMGMGLGMGVGVGGAMGGTMGNMAQNVMGSMNQPAPEAKPTGKKCPECGAEVQDGVNFCPNCGHKMVATCPKCGGEIIPGAKFCPNCGEKLTKVCSNCGHELAPGAKFCPECGTKTE